MTDVGDFADRSVHDPNLTSTHPAGRSMSYGTNKRKRNSLHGNAGDQDHLNTSGDGRRSSNFKRVAPNHNVNEIHAADNQAGASFMTQQTSVTSDDDINQSSNTTLDLHSLGDQDQRLHHNGNTSASTVTATAEAALSRHFQMTVPQPTDLSFQSNTSADDGDRSYMPHGASSSHHGLTDFNLDNLKDGSQNAPGSGSSAPGSTQKPAVGSDEWHKIRKDNHKEVERRRREMINEGINELSKIVPGCEKNKGAVLQRAVSYIQQLKDNEASNIEKWTLEKLLTEQAINELGASLDKCKSELQKAWHECEIWKKTAEQAGLVPEEYRDREDRTEGEGSERGGES